MTLADGSLAGGRLVLNMKAEIAFSILFFFLVDGMLRLND